MIVLLLNLKHPFMFGADSHSCCDFIKNVDLYYCSVFLYWILNLVHICGVTECAYTVPLYCYDIILTSCTYSAVKAKIQYLHFGFRASLIDVVV